VADGVVHEPRKVYEKAAKKVKKTLDYYIKPGEHWAGVAREMAFENPPLARLFLSWLSAYLWAVEDRNEKAVAEFLTAAVMGDGSIQSGEVTLAIGRFSADEEEAGPVTHVHKAALGVLEAASYAPERIYAEVDFREGEMWGSVKPPIEREVEVEGRRLKVRVEEGEARREQGGTREHLVVEIRAEVVEEGREVIVEKEAKFFKSGGEIVGYVNIHAGAEGGREADYARTAAVLKALGVESWSRKPEQIQLTGGALDVLMRLEPVCAALGQCRKT
jgi:hypothetical protein